MNIKKNYYFLRKLFYLNKLSHHIPGMLKPFVLCYHQIDPIEFEKQIIYLKKRFDVIDLKSFVDRIENNISGAYCAVTIDDCITEDVKNLVPICKKYDIPITLFLPVGYSIRNEPLPGSWIQRLLEKRNEITISGNLYYINSSNESIIKDKVNSLFDLKKLKTKDFENAVRVFFKENNIDVNDIILENEKVMPATEVARLSMDSIFSFQSHTYNHESLGICNTEEIQQELSLSKNKLEEITNKEVFAICYPYGSLEVIGSKIFEMVSSYYDCGLTLIQGVCTKKTNKYKIPRIGIYPGDNITGFSSKIYHYLLVAFLKK